MRRSSVALGPGLGILVLMVVYLAAPLEDAARSVIGGAILVVGPLMATIGCLTAARRAPRIARGAWLLLGLGAAVMLAGHLAWAGELFDRVPIPGLGRPLTAFDLLPAFHVLFSIGAVLALRPARSRGRAVEIALDAALVLVAAAVLAERFTYHELAVSVTLTRGELAAVLAGQLSAVAALYFGMLLVLRRDHVLPAQATPFLAGSAIALLAGTILIAAGAGTGPAMPGDAVDLVWFAGWAMLATAGAVGARTGPESFGGETADRFRRRLRMAVVPGAALFLGGAALDAALRPRPSVESGFGYGLLGVLLAIRIGHALRVADRQAEERRLLAQNRALVELSHALAGSTELGRTLELVARWAARLLDGYAAGIELLDAEREELELRAIHGLPSHILGMRFPVDGSFTGWVVRTGRARASLDLNAESFVRAEGVAFLGSLPTAAAPLRFRDRILGAVFAIRLARPFEPADLELLAAVAEQAAMAIDNVKLFEQVRALSVTDPLTGLANRRQLERDLAREFAAARRGRRLVAVLFDLDEFKEYNDRHGHLAGDEALRLFGRILTTETRAMNLAVRYGGDEFVVLLTEATREGAEIFIDRVAVQFLEGIAALGRGELTVSAGIAEFRPEMKTVEDLIAEADRNLYRTKASRPSRLST